MACFSLTAEQRVACGGGCAKAACACRRFRGVFPGCVYSCGRFSGLAACHSRDHCAKRNKVDKHQRSVIPQCSDREPANDTNEEQIQVPGRPTEPGGGVAHDLNRRCPPFDGKHKPIPGRAEDNGVRRHGSARRRCAGSALSCSCRSQRQATRSKRKLQPHIRSDPWGYAPCGLPFRAGCR